MTKTEIIPTETMTSCNGKIGNLGYCDKCGRKSEITSSYCIQLIPAEQVKLGLSDVMCSCKEKQRQNIIDMMKADEESGMYED